MHSYPAVILNACCPWVCAPGLTLDDAAGIVMAKPVNTLSQAHVEKGIVLAAIADGLRFPLPVVLGNDFSDSRFEAPRTLRIPGGVVRVRLAFAKPALGFVCGVVGGCSRPAAIV